jgi:ATP-dependent DNA ligase
MFGIFSTRKTTLFRERLRCTIRSYYRVRKLAVRAPSALSDHHATDSQAVKPGRSRRDASLPKFVPPQLSRPVETPPSGPQWVHEIKLDGYRMAARIDNGRRACVKSGGRREKERQESCR